MNTATVTSLRVALRRCSLVAASLILAGALAETAWSTEAAWVYESLPDPFNRGSSIHLASIELPDVRVSARCTSSSRLSEIRIYLDPELIAGMSEIGWAFDNRRQRRDRWPASPNHRSILVPARLQEDFVANLRARQLLTLSVIAGEDQSTEIPIPLTGSSAAVFKAMVACD